MSCIEFYIVRLNQTNFICSVVLFSRPVNQVSRPIIRINRIIILENIDRANTVIFPHAWCHCCHDATILCCLWTLVTPQLTSYPESNSSHVSEWVCAVKDSVLTSSPSFLCRVKELTVDPNQVIEGGRPNIHAVNQLELLDEDWLSISPQRDDLKLLCEQNVSRQGLFFYTESLLC